MRCDDLLDSLLWQLMQWKSLRVGTRWVFELKRSLLTHFFECLRVFLSELRHSLDLALFDRLISFKLDLKVN